MNSQKQPVYMNGRADQTLVGTVETRECPYNLDESLESAVLSLSLERWSRSWKIKADIPGRGCCYVGKGFCDAQDAKARFDAIAKSVSDGNYGVIISRGTVGLIVPE